MQRLNVFFLVSHCDEEALTSDNIQRRPFLDPPPVSLIPNTFRNTQFLETSKQKKSSQEKF